MASWPIGYSALPLLVALPLACLLCLAVPGFSRPGPVREIALIAAGLAVAGAMTATLGDALCLLVMALSGWLLIGAVARWNSSWTAGGAIAVIVAEFWIARDLLPGASEPTVLDIARTVGLSYMMFRIIHMIVDACGGELSRPVRFREYACYLLFPPAFVAGPIERFPDFQAGLHGTGEGSGAGGRQEASDAAASGASTVSVRGMADGAFLTRVPGHSAARLSGVVASIISGYFSFVVLAGVAMQVFAACRAEEVSPPNQAMAFISFAAALYFSFAGYTRFVRGFGCLLGFDLPPNFDRPWLSANFLDLWSRWHISLSDWFKIYLFNPLIKELIATANRPRLVPWLGVAGYFVTFFVMGIWHGLSVRFVLYGLCLGAGVSANKLYQTLMTQRMGRKNYAALTRRPLYRLLSRAGAVSYFVLALGFFWVTANGEAPTLAEAGAWLAAGGLVFGAVAALIAVESRLIVWIPQLASPVFLRPGLHPLGWPAAQFVAVLVYLLLLQMPVPPLLYAFF